MDKYIVMVAVVAAVAVLRAGADVSYESRDDTTPSFSASAEKDQLRKLWHQINKIKQCISPDVGFTATFMAGLVNLEYGRQARFDKVIMNRGTDYNPSTGAFSVSTPGTYSFDIHVLTHANHHACLKLRLNGQPVTSAMAAHDDWNTGSTSAVLELKQGDVVTTAACYDSSFFQHTVSDSWGYQQNIFSGQLIQAATCRV